METNLSADSFVSQIFLVEKDLGHIPVINLKGLNQFIRTDISKWRPAHSSRASTSRGLDGKNESERCIPSDAHLSNISATPDLPVEGQVLQVHLPALRSLGSSKGVYQGPEAGGGLLEASRLLIDHLPGQSTDVTS